MSMPPYSPFRRFGAAMIVLAIAACTPGQPNPAGQGTREVQAETQIPPIVGHIAQPTAVPFDEAMVSQLKVPAGFRIAVYAKGLGNPRFLAVADDGTVYVTRRATGDVVALKDGNNDGRADGEPRVVASGMVGLNGITIRQNRVYLARSTEIAAADIQADGSLATPQAIVSGLPDPGQHPSWGVAFGPDDKLYFNVGSPCNDCAPNNEEYATIIRADADGKNRKIFAKGLRNTFGFDWHPTTGALWGMDHGSDWRGDEQPPEELNQIAEGKDYGWPFCYGAKQPDLYTPRKPEGKTKEEYCAGTEAPALTYLAHAAPMDLAFYRGAQFPAEYKQDAIVTFHGSWNREQPVGYNVTRLRFENNKPVRFEEFVTGFLNADGKSLIGRPCGLAHVKDGSMLLSDDANGVIYRISYSN
jgi:glucose/arabinose dehydrogenase